ncbi:MAG: hypothetical protein CEE38_19055 [Planctomycetes bacterium B3_Pla]|nr:MAG: hypothetical protein CEE38_19055 [Planctomycetes bacterium B3_Pla]
MTVLYHYCSNAAFQSIVENRSIWLSALSLSSDTMEGKLVTNVIAEMAKSDGLDQANIQRLKESVSLLEQMMEGLGFCLSEKGDLLSQWRGYADDATGVSVGFSKKYLEKLSEVRLNPQKSGFTLNKVEYEYESQKKRIQATYDKIKELINQGAYKPLKFQTILKFKTDDEIEAENKIIKKTFWDLSLTILPLIFELFLLKTKAFQEEQEWRLISYLLKISDDECCFQSFPNKIVPYRKYSLSNLEENPIVEVILGPKNSTPKYVIDRLLKQNNFEIVNVVRSEASYR